MYLRESTTLLYPCQKLFVQRMAAKHLTLIGLGTLLFIQYLTDLLFFLYQHSSEKCGI